MEKICKPAVFIGSSIESLDVAYAIQQNLEHDIDPTVWTQGIFLPSRSVLVSLISLLNTFRFGIFVMAPDDIVQMRSEKKHQARDNVVFELGLFIGRLGIEKNFLILPRDYEDLRLPTDLLGVTPLTYNARRDDKNLLAALGPACNEIRKVIVVAPFNQIPPTTPSRETLPILSEEDIRGELESWFKNLPGGKAFSLIRFNDVDQDLRLPEGSTKKHLKEVVASVFKGGCHVVVKREGESTILFEQGRPPRVVFGRG